jgi:primosomal protein N' (replication factor Y) (superfamily II helicase)
LAGNLPGSAAGQSLAQVAVDLTAAETDRLFTYLVPERLQGRLAPGQWVRVPFGHQKNKAALYLGPAHEAPAGVELKALLGLMEELPPLPEKLIALARWMAGRYLCSFAAALRPLIPAEARTEKVRTLRRTRYRLTAPPDAMAAEVEASRKKAPKRAALLTYLAARPGATAAELAAQLGDSVRAHLKALLERGWIVAEEEIRRRDPLGEPVEPAAAPPLLTPEQRSGWEAIAAALQDRRRPLLLHGVTGSGKTELYMRAIAVLLREGKQAILLVPEISLTPQMIGRFRGRFGRAVAVLHSALSAGERYDEWQRIRRGEVSVAVGARSAVFAPFDRLGLIIVDEEHEQSYKQESPAPCYHARDAAEQRARLEGALLILGSATPALETYWRARRGELRLVSMPSRVEDRSLPAVQIVDMREELRAFNRSVFSLSLQEALAETLERREQAILFLNRRGYNTFILCRACGAAVQCDHCAVTMTYHIGAAGLSCHYCQQTKPVPRLCPSCGSKQIRYLGAGTERVEDEFRALFPAARALRMDVDTTQRKGSHAAILKAFGEGKADVLIGTQMIAKGLDYPQVTLVGVVLADTSLNLPDFRAAERTFQLVTQVAGRAGRGERPGRVVVQTYNPEHPALLAAARHDFPAFFDREIRFREQLLYPPFASLIHLVVSGKEERSVGAAARAVHDLIAQGRFPGEVLGPAPAPLARLRGEHRHHLVLKGSDSGAMAAALRAAFTADGARWRRGLDVKLAVDVDPVSIL